MYLDRCSIRVHSKIYTRILLRESYRMMQLRGEIFFSPCRHAKNSFIAMTAIPLSFRVYRKITFTFYFTLERGHKV